MFLFSSQNYLSYDNLQMGCIVLAEVIYKCQEHFCGLVLYLSTFLRV